jgi:hypothetical protein
MCIRKKRQVWASRGLPVYRVSGQATKNMAALSHGSRKFYEVPSDYLTENRKKNDSCKDKPIEGLLKYINDNCIGIYTTFSAPYGPRNGKKNIVFTENVTVEINYKNLKTLKIYYYYYYYTRCE